MNNLGQVAGYGSQYSATLPIDPPLQLGFVWSNGTWSTFNDPSNSALAVYAYGLNDSGQVVGDVGTNYFVWSQSAGLDVLSYGYGKGCHPAINDNGLVVGNSGGGNDFAYDTVSKTASTWTTSSGDGGWAYGVNNLGQVVGSDIPADTGYLWTAAGGTVALPGMAAANGIDSTGTYVAGWDSTANLNCAVYNTVTHAVTIVDYGSAPDGSQEAWAVNSSGVVVGESSVDDAFVYIPGSGETHLANAILSGGTAGADYVQAVSINNAGQILVQGDLASAPFDEHTWLLTPAIPGDANGDGRVDINDLTVVLAHYGQTGMAWTQGEFTGDGTVDINDLTIVLAHYGQSTASAAGAPSAVPEPASLLMLVAMFLAVAGIAVRRGGGPQR